MLRQSNNNLVVVGLLKSKKVVQAVNQSGEKTLSIELKVMSEESGKVHLNTIKLWSKESGKLFKGHQIVANEFKTVEEHGEANADRIKVTGNIEMNQYISKKDGELKTINSLKGVFASRVEAEGVKDEAGVVLECVILGHVDEVKDGVPTGRKKVKLLNVGYQNAINEIQNVYVGEELAEAFVKMYPINSTATLFIKIHNYVETKENEKNEAPTQSLGFGTTLSNMPDGVVRSFVNELVVVGGNEPELINKYSNEEIVEMVKLAEAQTLEVKKKSASSGTVSATPSGFGSGFGSTSTIADEDMPF